MHKAAAVALVALFSVFVMGCVTTERVVGSEREIRRTNEDPGYKDKTELDLIEQTEEQPNASAVWWQLGDYYERNKKLLDARTAHIEMQRCVEIEEKKIGQRFTGALYLLGKVSTLLGDYTSALGYLKEVLSLQPKDPGLASSNKNFRESHYLLGVIYFKHGQFELAEQHLVTFKELGGQHRADGYLIQIEQELGPRESDPAPASAPAEPEKG